MANPGFYKFDNSNLVRFAPTGVFAPNFTLLAAEQETYTYPVDGWYWFDSQDAAEQFFEINGQESANYRAFWDAILISAIYQSLYAYATINLPTNTALTAFIAAFQDAKEGRPNVPAIQACIYLVMDAAQAVLTAENLAELQALMDANNLSGILTLTPPAP